MRQHQGTLEDRYRIYCDCMRGTGETIISFDEWLNVGHVAKLEEAVEEAYEELKPVWDARKAEAEEKAAR